MFASAGVAGIIAGLAARPVLSNFFAGVQIAVSQPIRIDDAVIVENESGTIEEITFSYVVVKLWDLRRMVVPLSYFIEKPFQNWTRTGGELIGSVIFYVDHTAPVETIREKVLQIVKQSKLWNGKVVNLQVSDCKETTHRAARFGQRRYRIGGVGPALRTAREADRFSAARISDGAAAPALRNDAERCGAKAMNRASCGRRANESRTARSANKAPAHHHRSGLKNPAACSMTAPSANNVSS